MSRYELIYLDTEDPEWQDLHKPEKCLFTSSIISDILGFGYNSCSKRYDLMVKAIELKDNEFTKMVQQHGVENEPIAINQWYEMFPEYTGVKPGMAKYNDYILASCDQILYHKTNKTLHVLEIKCTVTHREFIDGRDVPPKWIAQCQIEMLCWNIKSCFLFIYQGPNQPHYVFEILYNQQIIDEILTEIDTFVKTHLLPKNRPKRKRKNNSMIRELQRNCLSVK
jgi:hypothetical protein